MVAKKATTSASCPIATSASSTAPPKMVPQKLRRNERERRRVDQVNQGFNKLRSYVPKNPGCKNKLSKVETLRSACKYIEHLQMLLGVTEAQKSSKSLPPTPDCSPSFPPPMSANGYHMQYDYNISPFYPTPNQAAHAQNSPGSSFYSDCSSIYDEHYAQ
ncbi:unnamed protein product [Caenorhabditis bovis]|uniref:BHLH domain-containing protein n=1 Tax=Caenorhabditis bovis TaxID=2654633 RepID=A0A8S1FEN8_9PELO|nr:unnamed protein product [Caenorhabditis bovis]